MFQNLAPYKLAVSMLHRYVEATTFSSSADVENRGRGKRNKKPARRTCATSSE